MKNIFLILILFFSLNAYADRGFDTVVTTLAVANVAQPLTSVEIRAFDIVIQNPSTNSVSIFLGDSDVATSGSNLGIELTPGQTLSLAASSTFGDLNIFSSNNIFIVSSGTSIPVVIGRITK